MKPWRRWWILACTPSLGALVLLSSSSTSCGDDSSEGGGNGLDGAGEATPSGEAAAPPTQTSACIDYITAICQRNAECRKEGNATQAEKQLESCLEVTALCPEYFFSPGSSRTIDSVASCAKELRVQPCEEKLAGVELACQTAGTLDAGAPCISGVQCASRTCNGFSGSACGTCAATYGPNAACEPPGTYGPIVCPPMNQECDPTTRLCTPLVVGALVPQGGACAWRGEGSGSGRCTSGTSCLAPNGRADAGTCSPPPPIGAPCAAQLGVPTVGNCSINAFCMYSNAQHTAGTCIALGQVNSPCGRDAPTGTNIPCDPNTSYCKLASASASGTCTAYAAINAPCTDTGTCGPTADCKLASPGVGTCAALAQPGEPCGVVTTGSGSTTSNINCSTTQCSRPPDGGPTGVCTFAPVGRGGACGTEGKNCSHWLTCKDGTCDAVDYTTCKADAGQADAGP